MEIQIKSSYRLPTPKIQNIFLKSFNKKSQDLVIIVVKILPNKLHLFYRNVLKEIWQFPFDIIDVILVNSFSNHDNNIVVGNVNNNKANGETDLMITCIVLD